MLLFFLLFCSGVAVLACEASWLKGRSLATCGCVEGAICDGDVGAWDFKIMPAVKKGLPGQP